MDDSDFLAKVDDGGYYAAHYVDHAGEGVLSVEVNLPASLRRLPAYSVISAPDFLPLVDQIDVQRWAEDNQIVNTYFTEGGPEPLCDERDRRPNPTLPNPLNPSEDAFMIEDSGTITAVVGAAAQGSTDKIGIQPERATSWLPDAAAGVFAPGWDTSLGGTVAGRSVKESFYAGYGLGSPFPEDAKLCAALNSFWPTAAPDVGRTFGVFTALPHLDEELGFHPNHPRVLSGDVSSRPGWDGEFGPFFLEGLKKINFARISRTDYTLNALNNRLRPDLLQRIDATEMLARMDGYKDCVVQAHRLLGLKKEVRGTSLRLIRAEKILDWSRRSDRLDTSLTGPGYIFIFVRPTNDIGHVNFVEPMIAKGKIKVDPKDQRRLIDGVRTTVWCEFNASALVIRIDRGEVISKQRPITT